MVADTNQHIYLLSVRLQVCMSTCNVRRAKTSLTSMVADTNQWGKQRQTFRLIYDNPKEHSHITQQKGAHSEMETTELDSTSHRTEQVVASSIILHSIKAWFIYSSHQFHTWISRNIIYEISCHIVKVMSMVHGQPQWNTAFSTDGSIW